MRFSRRRNPTLTPAALAAWRADMGWTKLQTAQALGISDVAWGFWERGDRDPPYYLVYALKWLRQTHAGV